MSQQELQQMLVWNNCVCYQQVFEFTSSGNMASNDFISHPIQNTGYHTAGIIAWVPPVRGDCVK